MSTSRARGHVWRKRVAETCTCNAHLFAAATATSYDVKETPAFHLRLLEEICREQVALERRRVSDVYLAAVQPCCSTHHRHRDDSDENGGKRETRHLKSGEGEKHITTASLLLLPSSLPYHLHPIFSHLFVSVRCILQRAMEATVSDPRRGGCAPRCRPIFMSTANTLATIRSSFCKSVSVHLFSSVSDPSRSLAVVDVPTQVSHYVAPFRSCLPAKLCVWCIRWLSQAQV